MEKIRRTGYISLIRKMFVCIAISIMFFACSEKEEQPGIEFVNVATLTQELFADQTDAEGVVFIATGAWSSTLKRGINTWVSFDPQKSEAAGQYTLNITLAPNNTGNDRIAVIAIRCGDVEQDVTITQKAVDSNGNLPGENPIEPITVVNTAALNQELTAYHSEGTSVVFFTTGSWSSSITDVIDQWISFSPVWGGAPGQHTVIISVTMNVTGSPRTAVFTIRSGGEEINITITQNSGVFTDTSCSALRPEITRSDIDAIPDRFYRDLATWIYEGIYDFEFRTQEYRAWQHPSIQAAQNRTWAYSARDNPTGIYVRNNEELVVLVGDTHGKEVSIISQELSSATSQWSLGATRNYPLSQGVNRIRAEHSGLIYVQYYDLLGEAAPKININFVTGVVNGYFDSQKHVREDWQRLLNNALAPEFDLLGKDAHLTMPTSAFKSFTPDGLALIDVYDDMMRLQHEFMGLYKDEYKYRQYKNRMYFHVDYIVSGAYATPFHTGYMLGWMRNILELPLAGTWALAHEVGHMNQIQPGLRWTNMIEVTNNIYARYVAWSWGERLIDAPFQDAWDVALHKGIPHVQLNNLSAMLIPFWQLYLYMHEVLGTDFYKDLKYSYMANHPTTLTGNGGYQLHFVRRSCDIAQLNLLDFFDAWGFLTPVNLSGFVITQAEINALKTEIEVTKGYPKPPKDFTMITDENLDEYR